MNKLSVASHLTVDEYKTLFQTYVNHNRSMGMKERAFYTLSDIVKVEKNAKDNCLNVYYRNGEWWHYTKDGQWY